MVTQFKTAFEGKQQKKKVTKPSRGSKRLDKQRDSKTKRAWNKRQKLLVFLITSFVLVMLVGTIALGYIMKDLPSPKILTNSSTYAVSSQIFDRNDQLLYEIYADENRIPVKLDSLPDHVWQASIAIEDQNFFSHFGFDLRGIARAIRANLKGERLEGGSTITQQLVKNALLTRERTLERKLKEIALSVMTETLYTKQEILEMYLNYIAYGGTAVGIEAAAKQYFDKSARDLTLAEASLLAGLPQAPSRYSPFQSDASAAKNRQKEVLRRMVEDGYITGAAAEEAASEALKFALSKSDIKAPHFVFFVKDWLVNKYGIDRVEKGGLRVKTTLDLDLQEVVQASLSAEIADLTNYKVGNGAAMVVKPDTGEILAMVGSKDYFDAEGDGQVNVALAQRQPGSSIKPIMYATAFQEKLLNPGSVLVDATICFNVPGQKPYCPRNYDGSFRGPVTVRQSLGNSLNIPAVKGLKIIGLDTFIKQGNKMGISSWVDPSRYGLSLTLGGGEVRMIDLAQAFSVLANQGVKTPFTPILSVSDYLGDELETTDLEQRKQLLVDMTEDESITQQGELERVMSRAPAYLTSHILQDNQARAGAFGTRSELVIPDQVVSVKTGTTNNLKDNWTVGFTPELLSIVWVGNNDGSPMNQRLVSGVTGAAPIWNDIMSYLLQDREPIWQEKPSDVKSAMVCANGMPPSNSNNCQPRQNELFWEQSQPSEIRLVKQLLWIDPSTGQPPPQDQQVDGLVLQEHIFYLDAASDNQCVDCQDVNEAELPIVL